VSYVHSDPGDSDSLPGRVEELNEGGICRFQVHIPKSVNHLRFMLQTGEGLGRTGSCGGLCDESACRYQHCPFGYLNLLMSFSEAILHHVLWTVPGSIYRD
jgi:hypothetical protein